ncbi:MAG: hypothetical protein ABR570_03595 [Burkholderiales bacterium]
MRPPPQKRDAPAPAPAPSQAEELLDLAIELTFPASDPVSVVDAFSTAKERASNTE